MSVEAVATVSTPIVERLIDCVCGNSIRHSHYLTKFTDNSKSLTEIMSELRDLRDDVQRRVEVAEAGLQLKRTYVVDRWLQRVEVLEQEVDLILQECSEVIHQTCFGHYYPRNWWLRYKLGKKVCKKIKLVSKLSNQGNFDIVAHEALPSRVQVMSESKTVGIDESFCKIWDWVEDEDVKTIGIFGMGGVGKTTLLNKLNNAFQEKGNSFNVVIWVVVSGQFNLEKVQKQIGKRLGLKWSEDDSEIDRAQVIFNVLRKKNFAILLDDIWAVLDFKEIGIPLRSHSKVVFTTRSEKVCGEMEANKKFKVPFLDWDQAWSLFHQKLGEETLNCHPEILKLAQLVARECCGLPLALITVARAMASKRSPGEWNHALKTLEKNASGFSGMEQKVLPILKLSYDSLEDETTRKCFLYCSLYPEDYDMYFRDLVYRWVAEGFLEQFEDMDDAIDKGHDVIGSLKAACLLEDSIYGESFVKMHDIVRDLALWIVRDCRENENKLLVQAGVGLKRAPTPRRWKDAERISLMCNELEELTGAPKCPNLLTLCLERNTRLSVIQNDFFRYMPILRVLDLSRTTIRVVPDSIGGLFQLQYLDLCHTKVDTLPEEMGKLVKLGYLNLGKTRVRTMPPRLISHLTRLQVLRLGGTCLDGQIAADLESLEELRDLGITIKELPSILLSQRLSSCITTLRFEGCKSLERLALLSSIFLRETKRLDRLVIKRCLGLREVAIICVQEGEDDRGQLSTLTELQLTGLPKLDKMLWTETCTHLHFKHLVSVKISDCGALKDISWLVLVPSLKNLIVESCMELEEIISDRCLARSVGNGNMFSKVVRMELSCLPKLKSIVGVSLPFSSLKEITVAGCPFLKKLPFASNSTNKSSIRILGSTEWWNELQWEDEMMKSSFNHFYSTADFSNMPEYEFPYTKMYAI